MRESETSIENTEPIQYGSSVSLRKSPVSMIRIGDHVESQEQRSLI